MTQTTNYNLPIVEAADKATWLTTFNQSMTAIDTALKSIADSINDSAITSDITKIKTALNSLNNAVIYSEEGEGITAQQYSNLTTVNISVE